MPSSENSAWKKNNLNFRLCRAHAVTSKPKLHSCSWQLADKINRPHRSAFFFWPSNQWEQSFNLETEISKPTFSKIPTFSLYPFYRATHWMDRRSRGWPLHPKVHRHERERAIAVVFSISSPFTFMSYSPRWELLFLAPCNLVDPNLSLFCPQHIHSLASNHVRALILELGVLWPRIKKRCLKISIASRFSLQGMIERQF